jgi:hypothetical protein
LTASNCPLGQFFINRQGFFGKSRYNKTVNIN